MATLCIFQGSGNCPLTRVDFTECTSSLNIRIEQKAKTLERLTHLGFGPFMSNGEPQVSHDNGF